MGVVSATPLGRCLFTVTIMSTVAEKCLIHFTEGLKEEAIALLGEIENPGLVKDKDGRKMLHWAAMNKGWLDIVKILVEQYHMDPMCTCNDGATPLHFASSNASLDVVKYLLTECNCDPMCTRNDGATLLHFASSNGSLNVVKYLLTECNCDPMCTSNNGATPLHDASFNGSLDVVKYLIAECNCDPMCTSNNGTTPLHNASCNGSLDVVKYLIAECNCDPMCTSNNGTTSLHNASCNGSLDVVKYLLTECNCDPMCTSNNGATPLHDASFNGSLDVVKYLIAECNCDPMCTSNNGTTPLHNASCNGSLDVVKYLIAECNCDPMCTSNNGATPLHNASCNGSLDVVKYLIAECNCDPMCTRNNGATPLHLACSIGSLDVVRYLVEECNCTASDASFFINALSNVHLNVIEYLLCLNSTFIKQTLSNSNRHIKHITQVFSKIHYCIAVDSFVNLYFIGDSGVGKTSLTKVITKRKDGSFWFGQIRSITGVELNTAGMIPHVLTHKEFGNIILHDLAGQPQYYSSHSAVIEDTLLHNESAIAVFVIVCKLEDSPPYKWLNLVKDLSRKSPNECYLISVASHADAVEVSKRMQLTNELDHEIKEFCKSEVKIKHIGKCYLDCRMLGSGQYEHFKTCLSQALQTIRDTKKCISKIDPQERMYCCMVYLILCSTNENVLTLTRLWEIVCESKGSYYVPDSKDKLFESLQNLQQIGLILIISCSECIRVVIDKKILFNEVNGAIFAPQSFLKIQENLASDTGISNVNIILAMCCLSFSSSLAGILSATKLCQQILPNHDPLLLVEFLISMKLCERITPEIMQYTNLTAEVTSNAEDDLLFFPSLMTHNENCNSAIVKQLFQFGWCLQCTSPHQYFSPRFLQLLILRLAYRYALRKEQDNPHQLRCSTIWSNGIIWNNLSGLSILVELVDNDQCVILLMSCEDGLQLNMIPFRRAIITDILSLQQEHCPSLTPMEFIIDPHELHYPMDKPLSLTLYDIPVIATVVDEKQPCVLPYTTDKSFIGSKKLRDVLPLEYDRNEDISFLLNRDLKV